jgi:hypothetical protein
MNQIAGLKSGVRKRIWQAVLGSLEVYPGTLPGRWHASTEAVLLELDAEATLLTDCVSGLTHIILGTESPRR